MIDYSKLTIEAFENKLNSSNDRIKEFFNSEEFVEKVSAISDAHNFDLSSRENLAFHKLATATMLGFIKPEELPEAILTFIETDEETARSAAEEISKVIAPLTQANPTQTPPPVAETPQAQATPQAQQPEPQQPEPAQEPQATPAQTPPPVAETPPAQPAPQKTEQPQQQPHLTKAPNPQEQSAKPFVIHEDVEVKPGTEQNIEEQKPTRPIFYKPSFNGDSQPKPAPTTVKVDLGNKESLNPQAAPKRKDYTIHTPKETTEEETGPVSNEEVHPENIVDLKDIPK